MSYILEALSRSEQERQRRTTPGLHSGPQSEAIVVVQRGRWPYAVAAALLAAVAVSAGWVLALRAVGRQQTGDAAHGIQPAPVRTEVPADGPPPAAATVLHQAQGVAAPPIATSTPPPIAAAARVAASHPEPPRSAKLPDPAPEPRAGTPASLAELPGAVQRELPKIAISGVSNAGGADDERMAIINDRALHEGDEVASGLKVERIAPDGVLFDFKGHRFRIGVR